MWLCFSLSRCLASEPSLQFDVFLGFDDVGKEACWLPLVCEVKNDGAAFRATVEATSGASQQRTRLEIELPTGTLKRVTLPLFCPRGGYATWDIRLLDSRGNIVAERPGTRLRQVALNDVPLLGSISRSLTGTPEIRDVAIRNSPQSRPLAIRLLPQFFPENPTLLESLSAIYINSEKASALTPGQTRALLEWLRLGGHIIVAVEQPQDLDASPWLKSILPVRFTGVSMIPAGGTFDVWLRGEGPVEQFPRWQPPEPQPQQQHKRGRPAAPGGILTQTAQTPFKELAGDEKFNAADLRVATGQWTNAQVEVASGGTPLVCVSPHGKGKITLLPFSPEREPVRSWKHLPVFWARLVEVPGKWYLSSDYHHHGGWSSDSVFGAMIETTQARKLPLGGLLLMLFGYVVLIGPLDYIFVRRLNRPALTWLTFPMYVAGFSAFVYFIGFRLRAGDLEWNEIHLVDAVAGKDTRQTVKGRSYGSIYSPANRQYAFTGPNTRALFRGESADWHGGGNRNGISVTLQGDTFKAEVGVPVWTSQMFVCDWVAEAEPPFALGLTGTAEEFKLTCDNKSSSALEIGCMSRDRVMSLGKIPPKTQETVEARLSAWQELGTAWATSLNRVQSAVQGRSMAFRQSTETERLDDWLFITQLMSCGSKRENSGYQAFSTDGQIDLCGALEQPGVVIIFVAMDAAPPSAPAMNIKPEKTRRKTIWRVMARVDPPHQ